MKKEHIIRAALELIREQAETLGLQVEDKGEGHAFDGGFWEGILQDTSHIPNVIARSEDGGYRIELRSFWGNPEIDIHRRVGLEQEYLCMNWSDSEPKIIEQEDKLTPSIINDLTAGGVLTVKSVENENGESFPSDKKYTHSLMFGDTALAVFHSDKETDKNVPISEGWDAVLFLNDHPELKAQIFEEAMKMPIPPIIYVNTGDFVLCEVRCDMARSNVYEKCHEDLKMLTDEIAGKCAEYEKQEAKEIETAKMKAHSGKEIE